MRNFKKFLALVLAMLMVSACAVSVSGAFVDQSAIDASGYASAVNELTNLGVIAGRGDGSFDPNATLTREEAAKIAAVMIAGSKVVDWSANTTCEFADVDAKSWAIGYINYTASRGVLEGTNKGFEPKKTLSIAEAAAMCVKMIGKKAEVAALDASAKPNPWYINYIDVAEKYGILKGVEPFSYAQDCTRAEMAQIAFNTITANLGLKDGKPVNKIAAGFNFTTATFEIMSVKDGVVSVKDSTLTFDEKALNAALKDSGSDMTVDALKGAKVTITYSVANNKIYGAVLESATMVFDYNDGVLAIVTKDNANTNKIVLDGKTYVVATEAEISSNGAIGGGSTAVAPISISKIAAVSKTSVTATAVAPTDGKLPALPAYYAAVAYDDNNDGAYDRIVICEYAIGTVTADCVKAETYKDVAYKFDAIKDLAGNVVFTNHDSSKDAWKNINYTGETVVYGETPVLYNVAVNKDTGVYDVNILEIAAKVSGKLTAISTAANYVTIDSVKYGFAASFVTPENWTLNQNVEAYTIDGKYVKFTGASKGELTVLVDNVVITDGKAVVTGYNVSDNYAEIKFIVEGAYEAGKLVSKTAREIPNTNNTESKKYAGQIAVCKDASKTDTDVVAFVEGGYYQFVKTDIGCYVKGTSAIANITDNTTTVYSKLAIKNGFVYNTDVATMRAGDNLVVIEQITPTGDDAKPFYAVSYNKSTKVFNARANVIAAVLDRDGDGKMDFVYITGSSDLATYTTSIPAGQTIVQILDANAIESTFDAFLYKAVDLMSGKVVNVYASGAVTKGEFYDVKDGTITGVSLWVTDSSFNSLRTVFTGLEGGVKASTTKLKKLGDTVTAEVGTTDKAYGIDQITVYVREEGSEAKRAIVLNDAKDAAKTLKAEDVFGLNVSAPVSTSYNSFKCVIVGNTMIVIK